ncbi:hypothetical protein GRI42_13770 [Erythrobacter gaetbuli]|uniref:Uncharacterized protein n=1 Tax=Qipengyuania gaetbuli TaxID=266952 RepID=A0A844Y2W3_9SPHN|nr:hypothetical protein [Qipengyuania gaetbuli]MXO52374.1 hypothetical protein [Qipengyuania gaetbuli]
MKVIRLSRFWRPERLEVVANRKVTTKNERPKGIGSKNSKAWLLWKRTNHLLEIRFKAEGHLSPNDTVDLLLSRSEVMLVASRFFEGRPDSEIVSAIRKARDAK